MIGNKSEKIESASPEKFDKKKTIEQLEGLKAEHFMYAHFIDALIKGEFEPMSKGEINKMVDDLYFKFNPLVPLDQDQESLLHGLISDHLDDWLNNIKFTDLCGDVYEVDSDSSLPKMGLAFGGKGLEGARANRYRIKKWNLKDKLKLFVPEFLGSAGSIKENSRSTSLTGYGNRRLSEYGFSDDEWKILLSTTRKATGKDKLTIMDLGCGMGKALSDMKRIDGETELHGLTMEQEPAMYPDAQYHYLVAERMPEAFKEKFDLIISNISFRYYLFTDVALENVILSLSKGGHAELAFSYDRIPGKEPYCGYFKKLVPGAEDSYLAMRVLVAREFGKLKQMELAGKIKLTYNDASRFAQRGNQGWLIIDKLEEISVDDFK